MEEAGLPNELPTNDSPRKPCSKQSSPSRRPPSMRQESLKTRIDKLQDKLVDPAVDIFAERPCVSFWSCCMILVLASAASVYTGMMTPVQQDRAWTIWDGQSTQEWEALKAAKSVAGRGGDEGNGRRLLDQQPQRRLDGDKRETLHLFYKASGSVFNAASLKAICDFEQHLMRRLNESDFSALKWHSPLRLFYGTPSSAPPIERQLLANALDCPELSSDFVAASVQAMHEDVEAKLFSSPYAAFIHPQFRWSMECPVTSARIEGRSGILDTVVEEAQDRVGLSYGFLTSAYEGDDDRFTSMASGTRIRIVYSGMDEFDKMITTDFGLALISIVLVFLALYIYIGSLFIATFGMLQIVLSLPLSALFYTGVFQIKYFEFVHVLVVYLVLGIGADDILVLVDTFKHIDAWERGNGLWMKKGLKKNLKIAYKRSITPIFSTSLTTVVAFLASSGSKVMPMRTCGWYAAICVMMNFVLTITFTPLQVAIWHERLQAKGCCTLDFSYSKAELGGTMDLGEMELPPTSPTDSVVSPTDAVATSSRTPSWMLGYSPPKGYSPSKAQRVQSPSWSVAGFAGAHSVALKRNEVLKRGIRASYMPFMSYVVNWKWDAVFSIRPGSLFVVIGMLAVALQGSIFTSQLTPLWSAEEWFPDNHMAVEFTEFASDVAFLPDHENYAIIGVFWGITGLDKSSLDIYKPDDFVGQAVYDDAFDLSNPEAQRVVLATCEKLRGLTCYEAACKNEGYTTRTLMMQSGEKAWSCFLEDFRDYIIWRDGVDGWPLPARDFNNELKLFRSNSTGDLWRSECCHHGEPLEAKYMEDIGFVDGELKFAHIRIRSSVLKDTALGQGMKVRDLLEDWIQRDVRSDIPGMQSVKFHGQDLFAKFDLGTELMNGLLYGCVIAAPIAFLVLLITTWNVIVSFYAILCVGGVVVSVLGFCKSAMDWDVGIGEAIAGVIVLGYSVDYIVHLSHRYCEAGTHHGLHSRGQRAAVAIKKMGSTVFAGAFTTAGSSIVMFFCFFYFFTKMAILICVTIMYSFLFSLGLLMGLLWVAGPQGEVGNLEACCSCE